MRPAIRLAARFAFVAPLLVAIAPPASAWGDLAHQAIARVAEHYLDPAVRTRALAILAEDNTGLVERDLAHEANWADRWRESDRMLLRLRYLGTRQWHYIDIPIDDPRPFPQRLAAACFGRLPLPPGTPAAQGPAESCLVDKLIQFRAELAAPAIPPAERLRALQFLLHFVSELHQPLHAANHDDGGGHDVKIHAQKGDGLDCHELHGCWDTGLPRRLAADSKALAERLIAQLGDAKPVLDGTPDDWAAESHEIARRFAYGRLPAADGAAPRRLDAAYVTEAQTIIEQRLARAGLRLAAVLNEALAAPR